MLRQVTQPPHIAGPLGVIAQIICAPNNTMIASLYTDSFVTLDCSLTHLAEKKTVMITGLPRNQPARIPNPSQACLSALLTDPAWRN